MYPDHTDIEAIVAKLWIIGRTYNAQIERRKTSPEQKQLDQDQGGIYHVVAHTLKNSDLDDKLKQLEGLGQVNRANLVEIQSTHEHFMRLLHRHLGQRNTSFSSKYLHFHYPHLFLFSID